jgi:hypothetical protein
MVRIAKPSNPKRIRDLKRKIHKKEYLELAIEKIAQTLTNELVGRKH